MRGSWPSSSAQQRPSVTTWKKTRLLAPGTRKGAAMRESDAEHDQSDENSPRNSVRRCQYAPWLASTFCGTRPRAPLWGFGHHAGGGQPLHPIYLYLFAEISSSAPPTRSGGYRPLPAGPDGTRATGAGSLGSAWLPIGTRLLTSRSPVRTP